MTALRDVTEEPEHFPPEIRTTEARTLYRLVSRLGTGLGEHATRIDQRFVVFERKLDTFIEGLRLELWALKGRDGKSDPPKVRPESQSSHEIEQRLDERMVESFARKAQETPGPTLTGTPQDLAKLAKDAATAVLNEERERLKNEANERIANEVNESREKWRTLLRWGLPSAFLLAVAGGLGSCVLAEAQHQRGILEERARIATPAAHP